jgi:hypothetical protein
VSVSAPVPTRTDRLEIALLMTNRMFCDMRRYIPASLAVF